jgi:hypothetical protein
VAIVAVPQEVHNVTNPSVQRLLSRGRFSRSSSLGAELPLCLLVVLDFRCKIQLSVENPKSAILTLRLRCDAAGRSSSSEERTVKSLSSSVAAYEMQ